MLEASGAAAQHMQSGAVSYQRGDLVVARSEFQAALALQQDLAPAKFNLGVIARDLEEDETAEAWFRELLAQGEIVAESHNNLGILAARWERYQEAIGYFRRAIDCRYEFPLAHFNLSTLLLRVGQWEEGWREYQWRWKTDSFTPLQCPQPQWDGTPLDGTLLLHTEQGIGDMLQFARFIPMIRQRCQRLIFVRPEHLACVLPAEGWADEVMNAGDVPLNRFQATLPMMSAPLALKLTLEDLPYAEGYLSPEQRQVDLGSPHVPTAKLKVAFAWCGSPTYANDAFRSTTIEQFLPLLQLPEIAFYSLQRGPRVEELNQLGASRSVVRDLSESQRDLADAAAIMRQMDLVISVDTSLLHLAGGLGIPAWGLLSKRCDWRWMENDREESPWYPSLRLFRQKELNDWPELMQRVKTALRERVQACA